jgi:hypothetical protein
MNRVETLSPHATYAVLAIALLSIEHDTYSLTIPDDDSNTDHLINATCLR